VTPLTIAQFQAQYSNPSFPSDQDIRRFLEQATWGGKGDDTDLQHIRSIGIPAYINEQFNTPPQFVDAATDPLFPLSSDYPFSAPYPQFYPPVRHAVRRDFRKILHALSATETVHDECSNAAGSVRQRVSFSFHKFIVVGGQVLNSNQPFW
jgi:hypothetical protein